MKEYHILSLSGGKDSTALAFFIKDNMPEIFKKLEFVFCDTECELPETYDYLNKIEVFLDKKIIRIKPYKNFDYLMAIHNYFPSPIKRWCTVEMKTKPFRKYVYDLFKQRGEGVIYLYIGIRADEPKRAKYNKYGDSYIKEVYPFFDSGLGKDDIIKILEESGIGLPDYYKWSNRSGCYFCPYQSKMTWINLYKNHPDLFMKAKAYEDEKNANNKGQYKSVGWNLDMRLEDMIKPENMKKIIEDYEKNQKRKKNNKTKKLTNAFDDEDDNQCPFCHS